MGLVGLYGVEHMKSLVLCLTFLGINATAAEAAKIDPKENAELTLKAPDKLKVKQTGEISFSIKPEKGWKVSFEAPLSVKLSNAGKVVIGKRKLGVKDGKKDGQGIVLSTTLEGSSAGADTVTAKAVYFLCTADVCKRFSASREIALKVK